MSAHCCEHHNPDPHGDPALQAIYRRVLWAALAINFGMFGVEVFASFAAGSAALQAHAMDFLGGTHTHALSLVFVGMALRYRATAALIKGLCMGALGLSVLATIAWHLARGTTQEPLAL